MLVEDASEIPPELLIDAKRVGVTAGASTPEILVQEVVDSLNLRGFTRVEELEIIEEDVHFPLPAPLEKFDRVVS